MKRGGGAWEVSKLLATANQYRGRMPKMLDAEVFAESPDDQGAATAWHAESPVDGRAESVKLGQHLFSRFVAR